MSTHPDGPEWILPIVDLAYRGRGVARHEGCVVFVPGVVPGETVRVRPIRSRKRYIEAGLVEVVAASPHRVQPACPLAGAVPAACPGCCYQHLAYDEELRWKQAQFAGFLQRQAGVEASRLCRAPVGSPSVLGYRNKLQLHAQRTGRGWRLGYFAEDNRTVLDVPRCPLAQDAINTCLAQRRADAAFMDALRPDATLTLRHTPRDGAVWWTDQPGGRAPGELREATPFGELAVPAGSFFQVNPGVAAPLLRCVADILAAAAPEFVVDAYCGVGPLAFAAASAGVAHVLGIDSDPRAIATARRNAAALAMPATFKAGPSEEVLTHALDDVDPARTAVVLDPPRRGLDRRVVALLGRAGPALLVYVSCAADTLARDLALLREAGFSCESAQLFDMFPRTPYFETVTVLRR